MLSLCDLNISILTRCCFYLFNYQKIKLKVLRNSYASNWCKSKFQEKQSDFQAHASSLPSSQYDLNMLGRDHHHHTFVSVSDYCSSRCDMNNCYISITKSHINATVFSNNSITKSHINATVFTQGIQTGLSKQCRQKSYATKWGI